jgi:hypothetical protein
MSLSDIGVSGSWREERAKGGDVTNLYFGHPDRHVLTFTLNCHLGKTHSHRQP